jgi:hypothetical protein
MRSTAVARALYSLFLLLVLCPTPSFAGETVDLSIVDRIRFTVPGEWKVIASNSDASRTMFAFQILNPADDGTPDSTNLVLVAYNLNLPAEKESFEAKKSQRGPGAMDQKFVEGWDCSTFSAKQKKTNYVDWDCSKIVGETGVFVRLAWPRLVRNAPEYDKSMEKSLLDVLKSVIPYSRPSERSKVQGN